MIKYIFVFVSLFSFNLHADVQFGENWIRYTFNTGNPQEVEQIVGVKSVRGWKYEMSPTLDPVCLIRSYPVHFAGAGYTQIQIAFLASQWLVIPHALKISENALFGISVRWQELDKVKSSFYMVPSTILPHWQQVAQASNDDYIYYLSSNEEVEYSVDLTLASGADDLIISVCFPFDKTTLDFSKLTLTYFQELSPE